MISLRAIVAYADGPRVNSILSAWNLPMRQLLFPVADYCLRYGIEGMKEELESEEGVEARGRGRRMENEDNETGEEDVPSGSSSAAGFSPKILSSSDWTNEISGSVYET